jgi:hypothetical protein
MTRIELKNTSIFLQDGLSGTSTVDDVAGVVASDVDVEIDPLDTVLNTTVTTLVPVGARFTFAGETSTPIHTVTGQTDTVPDDTNNMVFTPAYTAGTTADDAVITFLPQRVEITVGEGNVTYTEAREFIYDLDRGNLDSVREGDDQPLAVSLSVTFEAISTGTSETISPHDALTQQGSASGWVSSGAEICEVYAIDIVVLHTVACGAKEDETVTFPEFRFESFVPDYQAASIALAGRCKVTEPTVVRS